MKEGDHVTVNLRYCCPPYRFTEGKPYRAIRVLYYSYADVQMIELINDDGKTVGLRPEDIEPLWAVSNNKSIMTKYARDRLLNQFKYLHEVELNWIMETCAQIASGTDDKLLNAETVERAIEI